MLLLKGHPYYQIFYDSKEKLIEFKFFYDLAQVKESVFKETIYALYKELMKHEVKKVLHNYYDLIYTFSQNLLYHIHKEIYPEVSQKVKPEKVAFLLPFEPYTQYQIVNMVYQIDNDQNDGIMRRFFTDYDKAMQWLTEDNKDISYYRYKPEQVLV